MLPAIVIFVLVAATAASGTFFKPGPWYNELEKPSWTPPKWAFPVVWTILYAMIGVSGWLVWQAAGPASAAFLVWIVQLCFNAAWSWLFFGRKRMDLALVDVIALLASVIIYMLVAFPVSPVAAALFLPYAAWVATAATLNRVVMQMNPGKVRG